MNFLNSAVTEAAWIDTFDGDDCDDKLPGTEMEKICGGIIERLERLQKI